VTKTWKINRAVVKAKVEGTSLPADIAGHRLQEIDSGQQADQ